MIFRYSAVNTYYTCPEKYRRVYLLGDRGDSSLDLEFGTAVHSAIASHFDGVDAVEHFKCFWEMVNPTLSKSRFDYAELGNIGEILLSKWVKRYGEKYKPLHVEKRIAFFVGSYAFEGTPDFIGYYQDKLSVVDWKTTGYAYDKRKPIVDEQTWLYVHAAKQVYGLDIEQVVYGPLVKDGATVQTPIAMPVTSQKLSTMVDNVLSVVQDMSTRTVFPKNRNACLIGKSGCSYFTKCYPRE